MRTTVSLELNAKKLASWYRDTTGIRGVKVIGEDKLDSEQTIMTILMDFMATAGISAWHMPEISVNRNTLTKGGDLFLVTLSSERDVTDACRKISETFCEDQ